MISHTIARDALRILSEAANCIGLYEHKKETLLRYIEQQEAQSRSNLKTKYFAGDLWMNRHGATRRIISISPDGQSLTWEGSLRYNQHRKSPGHGVFTIGMTSWYAWANCTKAEKVEELQ